MRITKVADTKMGNIISKDPILVKASNMESRKATIIKTTGIELGASTLI